MGAGCCDNKAFGAACAACGVSTAHPAHQAIDWGGLVAESHPGLSRFWQSSTAIDAFSRSAAAHGDIPEPIANTIRTAQAIDALFGDGPVDGEQLDLLTLGDTGGAISDVSLMESQWEGPDSGPLSLDGGSVFGQPACQRCGRSVRFDGDGACPTCAGQPLTMPWADEGPFESAISTFEQQAAGDEGAWSMSSTGEPYYGCAGPSPFFGPINLDVFWRPGPAPKGCCTSNCNASLSMKAFDPFGGKTTYKRGKATPGAKRALSLCKSLAVFYAKEKGIKKCQRKNKGKKCKCVWRPLKKGSTLGSYSRIPIRGGGTRAGAHCSAQVFGDCVNA